jgi:hypothetical protein
LYTVIVLPKLKTRVKKYTFPFPMPNGFKRNIQLPRSRLWLNRTNKPTPTPYFRHSILKIQIYGKLCGWVTPRPMCHIFRVTSVPKLNFPPTTPYKSKLNDCGTAPVHDFRKYYPLFVSKIFSEILSPLSFL